MHIEYARCIDGSITVHQYHRSPVTGKELIRHDKTGMTCGIKVGRVSLESLKDCPKFNLWGWFMGKYDREKVDLSSENGNWPRGNPVF